jgi:hypothetical protein
MATDETKVPIARKATKREAGFSVEGKAFPGVDPDTGERKAVTWDGLRAEFGERRGSRLYNDLAVAAFGGVQPGRPDLSVVTTTLFRGRLRNKQGDVIETEEAYESARKKFNARAERVRKILADAESEAKENN